jgi:hypothetical protein
VKIVRLVRSEAVVVHRVASDVRVEAANAVIGPRAVVLMVIALAATVARAVTVLVAAGHSRWRRRLNSKN